MGNENNSIYDIFADDPHADPYAFLGFTRNPDGSITRKFEVPTLPASSNPSDTNLVLTKDVTINQVNKTWARVFLPKQALENEITKFPLIVDFHGGGFVICSAATAWYHEFYKVMATETPALIVAIDYRRGPEHRLPAAYDDGEEAIHWIKNTDDEWLVKHADFSNCFLMGSSAGANLAYIVGLRACSSVDDLHPLRIKGLILIQPYFGGTKRTQSEIRLDNSAVPPSVMDACWDMCLPIGADQDHEYCNPAVGSKTHLLDQIKQLGWKVLVQGCDGDALIDRQVEFAKMLEDKGVQVVSKFEEGGYHGIDIMEPEKAKAFCHLLKQVFNM